MDIEELEIARYEKVQRFCDIASTLLQKLTDDHLTVHETLCVLDIAKKTVEDSVRLAKWGSPFVCMPVKNTAAYSPEKTAAEIQRRKAGAEVNRRTDDGIP